MARTIVVQGYGAFVGKRRERLLVREPALQQGEPAFHPADNEQGAPGWVGPAPDEGRQEAIPSRPAARRSAARAMVERETPLFEIGEIVVPARGVTVSVDLLAECAARGIAVSFVGLGGKPFALLSAPTIGAIAATRREQLRAADDVRGAEICRQVVAGKLRNQAGLMTYFGKALADSVAVENVASVARTLRDARRRALSVQGTSAEEVREPLMAIEGAAGRAYWEGIAALCQGHARFEGRRREGDIGPVNALLNYGYGILYARVWAAVLNAGLDPFAGFLHTDRPGKPSLVLDLVEEFRAPAVDRAVLAHVRLGKPVRFEGRLLAEDTRRSLADAVIERLEATVRHRGRSLRLGSVVQWQARSLAGFLRREGEWKPFTMYW